MGSRIPGRRQAKDEKRTSQNEFGTVVALALHSVYVLGDGSRTFPHARASCNTIDGSVELAEFRAL